MSGKKSVDKNEIDEKSQIANEIVRDILEKATKLAIKVASCECDRKDECGVYKLSKELAKAIDTFQEKLS